MEDYLPAEIVYEIFSYLKPRELISCCCVCTRWNEIISNDRVLTYRKNSLDVYRPLKKKTCFPLNTIYADFRPFISPNQKDVLIVDGCRDKILVFGQDGKQYPSIELSEKKKTQDRFYIQQPWSVCVVKSLLFVLDDKEILVLDQHYNRVLTICTGDNYHLRFIFPLGDNGIAVIGNNSYILKFDLKGNLIEKLTPLLSTGREIKEWTCFCIDSGGRIIFAILCRNQINILDKSGRFLQSFGHPKGNIRCIRHIIVDQHDNIIVSHDSQVSIFTPEGKLLQEVPFMESLVLCLTSRGILSLGENHFVYFLSNNCKVESLF